MRVRIVIILSVFFTLSAKAQYSPLHNTVKHNFANQEGSWAVELFR